MCMSDNNSKALLPASVGKKAKELPPTSQFNIADYIGSGFWKDTWRAIRKSDGSNWALKFLNRSEAAYQQSTDRNLSVQEIWVKEGLGGNTTAFTNLAFHYIDKADDGTQFVAEEYIDRFLSDYLSEKKKLSIEETLKIGSGIATGLSDLHNRIVWQSGELKGKNLEQKIGWVHGDLKPDNIGYTTQGIVKITNFGAATMGSHNRDNVGYLYSRAPENFTGSATKSSDVYSAGAVMYKMFTGKELFEEEFKLDPKTFIESNYSDKRKWKKLINKKVSGMPSYMKKFFRKTLCHHEDRLKDGEELSDALKKLQTTHENKKWPKKFYRGLSYVGLAIPFAVAAGFFYSNSLDQNRVIIQTKADAEFSRKWSVVRTYYSNQVENNENILSIQQIDAYIDLFGDKKTAALAYLYPDVAVKAYAMSGGKKSFDELTPYVEKMNPDAVITTNVALFNGKDNWMFVGRSSFMRNTTDKFLSSVEQFKKEYADSLSSDSTTAAKSYQSSVETQKTLKLIGK